jgi:hypothetical protein
VLLRLPGSPMPLLALLPNPLLLGKPFGLGLSLLRVPVPGFALLPGGFTVLPGLAPVEPPGRRRRHLYPRHHPQLREHHPLGRIQRQTLRT